MEISKPFNEYFANAVKKLELFTKEQSKISTENSLSEVQIAISRYGNNTSIIAITEKMENLVTLHLASISLRMKKQ